MSILALTRRISGDCLICWRPVVTAEQSHGDFNNFVECVLKAFSSHSTKQNWQDIVDGSEITAVSVSGEKSHGVCMATDSLCDEKTQQPEA